MVIATDNSLGQRLRRLLNDPMGTLGRRLGAREADTPAAEPFYLYGKKARGVGIDQLYLFLSFDCDTDLDIAASSDLHSFLHGLGLQMTMAVPGTQLRNGAAAYGALAAEGVEFINHGFLPHAAWVEDRYVSATFYHDMPKEDVARDIRSGHLAVLEVTGRAPLGFRAPHFGHFQEPEHLELVYGAARELGYRYCSTTSPSAAYERGPVYDVGGLLEVPTSGSVRSPTTILDSWTYLTDRRDYVLSEDYADLMIETVDTLLARGIPGVLAWYADPAHVIGQEPFERAMRHIAKRGIVSLTGTQTAGLANSKLSR